MRLERIGKMANKLKNIFSKKDINIKGKLNFVDEKAYKDFRERLDKVYQFGETADITKDILSVDLKMSDGNTNYLRKKGNRLAKAMIELPREKYFMDIDTKYGQEKILFYRYKTKNEIVVETKENEIVYMKIAVNITNEEKTTEFSYRIQPNFGENTNTIIRAYARTIVFLDKVFLDNRADMKNDNKNVEYLKDGLVNYMKFFERQEELEKELGLSFNCALVKDEEMLAIEELYFLLVEKKIIKEKVKSGLDNKAKLEMENAADLEVNSKVDITLLQSRKYEIYGEKIEIYTANLLNNVIIKERKEEEDGAVILTYGDTDSNPMYMSYKGFRKKIEAQEEIKTMMSSKKVKEDYVNALSLPEALKEKIVGMSLGATERPSSL